MSKNAFILYGSYQNPYLRLVRIVDGLVFDVAAGKLVQAPAWVDSALSLDAKDTAINGWPVSLPTDLPNGAYDLQLYDAAAPGSSDSMVTGWRLIMPHKLVVNPTEFPLDIFGRIRTSNA